MKDTNDEDQIVGKAILPISAEALRLVKAFADLKPGELMEDAAVLSIVGRDLKKAQGVIRTAIRRTLNEYQIVIYRVRVVGWKRAEASEIVQGESSMPHRIGRMAGRASRRLAAADYGKLAPQERQQHNCTASLLGAIQIISKNRTERKLIETTKADKVDVNAVLDLCK